MKLIISLPAKADFENILNYTFEQWGVDQMYDYESSINGGFVVIKDNIFLSLGREVTGYDKPTLLFKD